MMGAHVIKTGVSRHVIDLLERGYHQPRELGPHRSRPCIVIIVAIVELDWLGHDHCHILLRLIVRFNTC